MKTTLLLVAALCVLPLFCALVCVRGSGRLTCRLWRTAGATLDRAGLTAE